LLVGPSNSLESNCKGRAGVEGPLNPTIDGSTTVNQTKS
jgi:hypothetical protein